MWIYPVFISLLCLLYSVPKSQASFEPAEDLNAVPYSLDEEPSDYEIWSAIVNSVAEWEKTNGHRKSRIHKRSEEIVCYDDLGCFRDEGAFDYLDALPESPEVVGTKFILYTNENRMKGDILFYDSLSSFSSSHFNSSHPVKVIIHGFASNGRRMWILQMTEALLAVEDANVIVVDWERGSLFPNYVQAAANTQLVGKQLAILIRRINSEYGLTNDDYHLIGFSLGAHVAGFAGAECPNISRITGLDPAAMLFEGYEANIKLDPSDATFVDVIHTNGDSLIRGGLGTFEPSGHADFYPNGGRFQTGCDSVFLGAVNDIFYGQWQSLCSHRRALRFFIESIEPNCGFPAFPCDSLEHFLLGNCFRCPPQGCIHMGYYATPLARGKHYLVTRGAEPFCPNQYRISISSTRGQGTTWGTLEISFIGEDNRHETFILSSGNDIVDNEDIQGLIVADPNIRNVSAVVLHYTKYKPWLKWGRSGQDKWDIDTINILSTTGHTRSFCGSAFSVPSGEPKFLPLISGDCLKERGTELLDAVVLEVVDEPIVHPDPRINTELWRIQADDTAKYRWDSK